MLAVGAAVLLTIAVGSPTGRTSTRVAQIAAVQPTTDDGQNALF
jgi:hypothetical protein